MKDILIHDFQLQISKNGDFEIGTAENQSVEMLLISNQGEWKEYPEAGCDIVSAKNGTIDSLGLVSSSLIFKMMFFIFCAKALSFIAILIVF